jgi:hypothetical protein
MSIQRLINVASSLAVNRRKVVGIQYTRNEIVKTSATPTRNPWRFTLNIPSGLQYHNIRDIIETIDNTDRNTPEIVSFSGVRGQSFIFAYRGDMTQIQRDALRVNSFTGTSLILNSLPTIGAGAYLFKKGDLIQIADYPYPFTVTADVVRGTGGTVTVTTHRGNWITDSVVNKSILVGNACQFRVICTNMPTYKLVPGGTSALVEWTSDFELFEYTGDVL